MKEILFISEIVARKFSSVHLYCEAYNNCLYRFLSFTSTNYESAIKNKSNIQKKDRNYLRESILLLVVSLALKWLYINKYIKWNKLNTSLLNFTDTKISIVFQLTILYVFFFFVLEDVGKKTWKQITNTSTWRERIHLDFINCVSKLTCTTITTVCPQL